MRSIVPSNLEAGRMRDGFFASHPDMGFNGMFHIMGPCGRLLRIITSDGTCETEKYPWEHVSVSTQKHVPNWEEMCFVKNLFWRDDETVIQFHPAKEHYAMNDVRATKRIFFLIKKDFPDHFNAEPVREPYNPDAPRHVPTGRDQIAPKAAELVEGEPKTAGAAGSIF